MFQCFTFHHQIGMHPFFQIQTVSASDLLSLFVLLYLRGILQEFMDKVWTVLLLSILLSRKKMNNRMNTTEEEQQRHHQQQK